MRVMFLEMMFTSWFSHDSSGATDGFVDMKVVWSGILCRSVRRCGLDSG